MFYLLMIIWLLSSLMLFLNFILSKTTLSDREKSSPFECGFDPISNNHMPFSVQFFIISLIFLIFDIEITLLIPLIFLTLKFNLSLITCSFIFLIILIYGLYMEYLENSIDWKL
uniref:NADH-ubiquinone oxidoreductase chain 3 n=1 Tax=Wasmannia auropunctata TaxID=64793 RepID=A0A191TFV2_WASAN|nr:NADH dehydrogenase subunit 3 [Wasmannia auropunctata]ANI87505.1 NADH dehydrogenase subunit 3 [Wasmannia auropunctata]